MHRFIVAATLLYYFFAAGSAHAVEITLPGSYFSHNAGDSTDSFTIVPGLQEKRSQLRNGILETAIDNPDAPSPQQTFEVTMEVLQSHGGSLVVSEGTLNFRLLEPQQFLLAYTYVDPTARSDGYDIEFSLGGETWTFAGANVIIGGLDHRWLDAVGNLSAGDHTLAWRATNTGTGEPLARLALTLAIPEPATWALMALSLVGVAWARRTRRH